MQPEIRSIQIFRPGRHMPMTGDAISFSEADLRATAAAYNPARHEAPLVVGHPTLDAPAYGWVKSLSSDGSSIEAVPHQVDAAFAEMVKSSRFKKISASFYAPDSPSNPVPGVFYLRHVGFLGAVAPAVKGLRAPEFAASEQGVVEFSEWDDVTNAGLWRSLRDWFIGKFGQDEADRVIPTYSVANLEQSAQDELREAQADAATTASASTAVASPAFASPAFASTHPNQKERTVTPEQAMAIEAENTRLKADLAAAQAAQRKLRMDALHSEHVAFAEQLVAEARIPVSSKDTVVATLDHLASQDAEVAFGEGAARKPLATEIKSMLKAVKPSVEFGEVATTSAASLGVGNGTGIVEFAAPAGYTVDAESLLLHRKVKSYQAAHPGTAYPQALAAVQAGQV